MRVRRLGAALGILALLAGCGTSADGSTGTRPSSSRGAAAATPPCPAVAAATGAPVPDGLPATTLRCLGTGPAVRLSDLRGTPTVLNFWAAWCTECRKEMPYFRTAMRDVGTQVRFLGVHAWAERGFGRQSVVDFGVPFPSLDGGDSNEVPASVRVTAPPTTLFVNAAGRVVWRKIGVFASERELEDAIATHLGVRT